MFTGIIESVGKIVVVKKQKENLVFKISSSFSSSLKIDQSVSHNGVCLTVTNIKDNCHEVVAIHETLKRSNLKYLKENDEVNLERSTQPQSFLDGHIVQGHVDMTAKCIEIKDEKGSFLISFQLPKKTNLIVEKGSITINGISLTVVEEKSDSFKVGIIPYTLEHTTLNNLKIGDEVNIEFDIIGKYVQKMVKQII